MSRFTGMTILAGVLFLAPIVVLAFVLNKTFVFVQRGLQPVTALIPDRIASGPTTTAVASIVLLALACFLAGLFARTLLAQNLVTGLEQIVLSKLPGYEYLKEAGTSVLGLSESAEHPVVFANLGGAWRIAVQTESIGGDFVAVFVPNSPNPMSGSLFLVAADRVRPANVPLASAIACLRRCGMGAGPVLEDLASGDPAP
jgi:uncharacterized membrane protein